eukprot:2719739-Pleurochrysis_carterae.AAC.1
MPPTIPRTPNADPPTAPQLLSGSADIADDEDNITPSPPDLGTDDTAQAQNDGDEGTIADRIMRR